MDQELLRLANENSTALLFEASVLELLQRRVGFDVAFFSLKSAEATPTVVGLGADLVERAVRGGPRYYVELLPVQQAALKAHGVAVTNTPGVLTEATADIALLLLLGAARGAAKLFDFHRRWIHQLLEQTETHL